MERVEYKIREVNRRWLDEPLKKLGLKKVFEGEIFVYYYDRPSDKFQQSGKRLTVSSYDGKTVFSYRDRYSSVRLGTSEQYEVEVSDPNVLDKILTGMGFTKFMTFRSMRVDYEGEGVEVSFEKFHDDLEYIPEFMMIEAGSDKDVFEIAEKFGYKKEDCKATSVMDLIRYYKDLAKFADKY